MKKPLSFLSCLYRNHTKALQVIRLKANPCRSFERTLFPGEAFQFKASSEAFIEVGTYRNVTAIACDRIRCQDLAILQVK